MPTASPWLALNCQWWNKHGTHSVFELSWAALCCSQFRRFIAVNQLQRRSTSCLHCFTDYSFSLKMLFLNENGGCGCNLWGGGVTVSYCVRSSTSSGSSMNMQASLFLSAFPLELFLIFGMAFKSSLKSFRIRSKSQRQMLFFFFFVAVESAFWPSRMRQVILLQQ